MDRLWVILTLVFASMRLGLPGAWAQDDSPAEVTVPDAALRAVLEDSLGLAAGAPILATELAELTGLEARDAGILDLTGLEHATGLTRLHLGPEAGGFPWDNSNDISDLSPLSGLTSLTWLNLAGNPVSDLTPLSRLTGLSHLNLQGCPIFDESLSPLASLTGLTDLYLAFTGVMDAASLSGLAGLTVHGISLPRRYPKLDGGLNRIVEQYETARQAKGSASRSRGDPVPSRSIPVRIVTDTRTSAAAVTRFLETRGVTSDTLGVGGRNTSGLLWADVHVSLLARLSEQPGVLRVSEEVPSMADNSGSQAQSSVTPALPHGVQAWRDAGIRGQGVVVGVIDVDFKDFRTNSKTSAKTVVARCYPGGGADPTDSVSDCEDDKDHGTLVTETLLDIAPDVSLYISNPPSQRRLRETVAEWTALTEKEVQVINASRKTLWDGPGDGTSPRPESPLKSVDAAVDDGILGVNSAGNSAQQTWYSGSDPLTFNAMGWLVLDGNTRTCMRTTLMGDRVHWFQLRWEDSWRDPDDPTSPGASRNLNLRLYRIVEGNMSTARESDDLQLGDHRDVPLEFLGWGRNSPEDDIDPEDDEATYCFGVQRVVDPAPDVPWVSPRWVQVQAYTARTNYPVSPDATPSGSINNPAESANPGMLAVGGADVSDPPMIRAYSSRGPAPEPTPGGRTKPDLVGVIDQRSGTSFSSPRVAGLAALVIQELGDIYTTPAQVAQYLRDNAVQQATPDPNNTWGHGFAELPARPAAPGSPTVEASAGGVLVSWNRVPRPTDTDPVVEGYRLEFRRKSITGTGDWSDYELLAVLTDATSFSHTTTTETHPFDVAYRYQYRVRARPAGHWSSAFPVGGFVMPPSAPQNPTATAANGDVTLNWDAPASTGAGSALDGYEYRQSADGGTTWVPDWTDLGSAAATTRTKTLTGLSSCATYTFQIRARIEPVTGTEVSGPAAEITHLRPAWSGRLASNKIWRQQVCVEGDVTVASGSTLSLAQGTEVRFDAGRDKTAGGSDAHRSELIVQGTLEASAGGITFRSSNDDPSSPEWHGIRVEDGGTATLTNVTVRDGVHCTKAPGTGTLTRSGVTLTNCGTAPTVTGNQAPEYAEHGDDTEAIYATVADYTAEDPERDAVRWELHGADKEWFTINPESGELRFAESSAPNFEAPAGSRGNTYEVTVRAVDSQQAVTDYPVTVMVTNVDEMGRVDLSPAPPRVDEALTGTLSDPDGGVSSTDWQWQGRAPDATAWTTVSDPAASTESEAPARSTYKPLSSHVGWVLRAVVDPYADGHGAGKRAVSGETGPVLANGPTAPRVFTASAEDSRVTLSWNAPESNRGATITGYAYRYTRDENTRDQTSWTAGTLGVTTRHLITGLDNGTPYTFELWALNPAAGDAAPAQATPAGPFTLAAAGRDEYVSLSWTPAPVSGPPVRYYSYRRSNDGGSTWTRWSSMWARLPGYPADPLYYVVPSSCGRSTRTAWSGRLRPRPRPRPRRGTRSSF